MYSTNSKVLKIQRLERDLKKMQNIPFLEKACKNLEIEIAKLKLN